MGIRFNRRIRILPWVYLNWGKGGFSFSFGPRGAKINVSKKGVRGSLGLPGTGIRYETPYYKVGQEKEDKHPLSSNQNEIVHRGKKTNTER